MTSSKNKRVGAFFRLWGLPVFFLILIVNGCGEAQTDATLSAPSSGSAKVKFRWHPEDSAAAQSDAGYSIQALDECDEEGVDFIQCDVFDTSSILLISSPFWPCSQRKGLLEEIPAGSNRSFVCKGVDDDDNVLYSGRTDGVQINIGQTTETGIIDFYPFVPELVSPEDGGEANISGTGLVWQAVTGAVEYRVQVAETDGFDRIVLDEITAQTALSLPDLAAETDYFWRVFALDLDGGQGPASQVWQFRLTENGGQEAFSIAGLWQWEVTNEENEPRNPCGGFEFGFYGSFEFLLSGNLINEVIWITDGAWVLDINDCTTIDYDDSFDGRDTVVNDLPFYQYNITEPLSDSDLAIICALALNAVDLQRTSEITIEEFSSNRIVCSIGSLEQGDMQAVATLTR